MKRKATKLSPAQLEKLAEVSPSDLEEAKAWARKHSRPGDGGLEDPAELLNARLEE